MRLENIMTDSRNVTCSQFEQVTKENSSSQLKVKGISGPDLSCNCVSLRKTIGNGDANKAGQAVQSRSAKSLTQFVVKVCGKEILVQKDLNTTTVKDLIESACHKAGIHACDSFATYGGKVLKADKLTACYPIFKDSTVCITPRLRGGRMVNYGCETFDELMGNNKGKKFHQVALSRLLTNTSTKTSSVTFLSRFSAYYIHKILIFVRGKHREGKSFNGQFDIKDILIVNRTMVDFDSNVQEFSFTRQT